MMVWLALACGGSDPKPPVESEPSVDIPEVTESEWGDIVEPVPPATNTRQLKRMTVAQVRDSMERIADEVVWGSGSNSDWDAYAETLGVADYQLRVTLDLSPSIMFQKFLDDAAGATCAGWIAADESTFHTMSDPDSTERADLRENIVGLRWKIQGKNRDIPDDIIDRYETVFTTVHTRTASTEAAWTTVCVAMFTHPDFFMY